MADFGLATYQGAAQALAVADAEVRKLLHDPWEVLTRAVQPVLWLMIFGQVMARLKAMPSENLPYKDFLAPGILAQSVTVPSSTPAGTVPSPPPR